MVFHYNICRRLQCVYIFSPPLIKFASQCIISEAPQNFIHSNRILVLESKSDTIISDVVVILHYIIMNLRSHLQSISPVIEGLTNYWFWPVCRALKSDKHMLLHTTYPYVCQVRWTCWLTLIYLICKVLPRVSFRRMTDKYIVKLGFYFPR